MHRRHRCSRPLGATGLASAWRPQSFRAVPPPLTPRPPTLGYHRLLGAHAASPRLALGRGAAVAQSVCTALLRRSRGHLLCSVVSFS